MSNSRLFLNLVIIAVLIVGAVTFIADLAQPLFHIPQRTFNICFLFGVLPICIGLSDLPRRARPDLFNDKKK